MRAVIDTNVLIYDTFEDSIYHSEAKNLLDTLEQTKLIGESEKSITSALNSVLKENFSLSRYNDKVILSLALGKGLSLATFDEKLRKQAIASGLKVLPDLG